jgi:hypothetical protein
MTFEKAYRERNFRERKDPSAQHFLGALNSLLREVTCGLSFKMMY